MREYRTHEIFDAPVEVVFRIGVDPASFGDFFPNVERTWEIVGDGTHVGDGYRFQERYPGRHVRARTEIVEVEPPVHWKSVTHYEDGPCLTWTSDLVALPNGRTEAEDHVVYEGRPGIVSTLVDRLLVHRVIAESIDEAGRRFRAAVDREVAVLREKGELE